MTTDPNPDSFTITADPNNDAVGPYEAASYLNISISGWEQMLGDGVVATIPNMPGYVRRRDLHLFRVASDVMVTRAMIEEAEAGHGDGPEVFPIVPPDDDDWIRALVDSAAETAHLAGWRMGFAAGLSASVIVIGLVLILATWLRG